MSKLISNVLIKLIRGGFTDRVLFIDNVPEDMFYEMKHPRICVGKGMEQHWEADLSKPKEPTLYPEINLSQTGDGGLVFDLDNEQSKHRYLALDRYMKMTLPNNKVPVEPIINAVDPTDTRSAALALSQVPRVVLPALSPSESKETVAGSTTVSLDVEAIKKQAIAEYEAEKKAEISERMAKAREARTLK